MYIVIVTIAYEFFVLLLRLCMRGLVLVLCFAAQIVYEGFSDSSLFCCSDCV